MFSATKLPLSDAIHHAAGNHRRRACGHQRQAGLEGTRACRLFALSNHTEIGNPESDGTLADKPSAQTEPNNEPSVRSV
jgi:hypothetical protein